MGKSMVTLSTETETKAQIPSQPVGNTAPKSGINLEGYHPADHCPDDRDLVAQRSRPGAQHWRPHHLDQVIHVIEGDDLVTAATELVRQPEHRRYKHQDLDKAADKRRDIAKS